MAFLIGNAHHGLMRGPPSRQTCFDLIAGLTRWARADHSWVTQGNAANLLPARIWSQGSRAWEREGWYDCQGLASALSTLWLQQEFERIEAQPLEALRGISWGTQASNWSLSAPLSWCGMRGLPPSGHQARQCPRRGRARQLQDSAGPAGVRTDSRQEPVPVLRAGRFSGGVAGRF